MNDTLSMCNERYGVLYNGECTIVLLYDKCNALVCDTLVGNMNKVYGLCIICVEVMRDDAAFAITNLFI